MTETVYSLDELADSYAPSRHVPTGPKLRASREGTGGKTPGGQRRVNLTTFSYASLREWRAELHGGEAPELKGSPFASPMSTRELETWMHDFAVERHETARKGLQRGGRTTRSKAGR